MSEETDGKILTGIIDGLTGELEGERAKVAALMGTIESQKQTHDALIKRCRELEDKLERLQKLHEPSGCSNEETSPWHRGDS